MIPIRLIDQKQATQSYSWTSESPKAQIPRNRRNQFPIGRNGFTKYVTNPYKLHISVVNLPTVINMKRVAKQLLKTSRSATKPILRSSGIVRHYVPPRSLLPSFPSSFPSTFIRPFEELERAFSRLPRFWDFPTQFEPESRFFVPIDLKETKEKYVLTAEVPGVKKEDIKINVSNGVLTITGETKAEKTEETEQMHYRERSYGKFSRSIRLPEKIDPKKIDAKYENGVVSIDIPKLEPEKEETINVELK